MSCFPHIADVLFGRGTGSNMHSGNIKFRALIQKYKPVYRDTPKKLKPSVSSKVVAIWRAQDPPGRFLTRSDRFNGSRRTFYDVGDAMARRKAAQCLREKSSMERMEMQSTSSGVMRAREEEGEDENTLWGPTTSICDRYLVQEQRPAPTATNDAEEAVSFPDLANVLTSTNFLSNEFLSKVSTRPDSTDSKAPASGSMSFSSELDTKNIIDTIRLKTFTATGNNCGGNVQFKLPANFYKDETSWFGAHKQDKGVLSLMGIYAAESDDFVGDLQQRGASDSPLFFASFDLGNTAAAGDDDGGLCFPSLLGGNTAEKCDPTLSSVLGGDDDDEDFAFPSLASIAPDVPNKRVNALQTIRDTVPTAAMLTTGLFDF
jgi:hypothetical protein